jgi:hypothetical protein
LEAAPGSTIRRLRGSRSNQAARRAHSALGGIRGANQRAAAAPTVRAIESLLPADAKTKEAYALGYKDGAEDALKKGQRDDVTPHTR